MCRAERDRRRELEAAARALAQEEKLEAQKDRDELAQKEAMLEKSRAAKRAQKEKKAQKRVAAFVERKNKRKALAAQQREDAERARLGTLWREKFYYLVCAIMSMVVVPGLVYAWFFSSLMEPVKAAGGPGRPSRSAHGAASTALGCGAAASTSRATAPAARGGHATGTGSRCPATRRLSGWWCWVLAGSWKRSKWIGLGA